MAVSFNFEKRLGSGHFGEVWSVIDTGLDVERALKLIPKEKILDESNFFREAQILKSVEHPNIVRVEETGKMDDGRVYIAMEYLEKGSLDDEASGSYVPLTRAQRITIDMLRGLEYAHQRNIIHRDIKPANILVGDNNEGKLSDFGLAVELSTTANPSKVGNYNYLIHMAPELTKGSNSTVLSDIYACGLTLYRLINGDSFLPAIPRETLFQQIQNGKYPNRTRYREFIPRNLRIVINKALSIAPQSRYQSAEEMRHAIEKIDIHMNWHEKVFPLGRRWVGSWNQRCYTIERGNNIVSGFYITTSKGRSKETLRRVRKHCHPNLKKDDAIIQTKRILQDIVLGRIS